MAGTHSSLLEHNKCPSSEWNYLEYLTEKEAEQIREQFRNLPLKPGCQVMWCGVPREWAQHWADENGMQTLTTAMGPLMMTQDSSCPKQNKNKKQWKRYIMGASGLFAHQLPKGVAVTVLCRPPPQRLHPQGSTTYQSIEEPILKGILDGAAVSCIEMVHPTVEGAEAYRYQVWPTDEADEWTRRYGNNRLKSHMRKGSKRYIAQVPSFPKELKTR
jgi:hypothetical protein